VSHLARALVALAITGSLVIAVPIVIMLGITVASSGRVDLTMSYIKILLPQLAFAVAALLLLLCLPLVFFRLICWCYPAVGKLWISALFGALCGALLSPLWYHITGLVLDDNHRFSWGQYRIEAPFVLTFSIIGGSVFFFLHSFLIRRATAKQQWLATRAQ